MLTVPWSVSMPVLRCALMANGVMRNRPTETEGPWHTAWKHVAWTAKVAVGDDSTLEAELRVIVPGEEELDTHHDWDWDKGDEQDARAEKERIARMRRVAWCDFCGNHVRERRCCYGCKQIGVMTYYCDRECQVAAWRLQPKHRCGC